MRRLQLYNALAKERQQIPGGLVVRMNTLRGMKYSVYDPKVMSSNPSWNKFDVRSHSV